MKKQIKLSITICVVALCFAGLNVKAQVVSIPDANFKAALIAAGVDKNNDGEIQESEALLVEKLDVYRKDISSLEGIAAFKQLTFLSCGSNNLQSLELSNNTGLIDLMCSNNKFTSLDLSALVNLKHVFCSINKLTVLNVLHSNLTLLDCSYNDLTELDLSSARALSTFDCSHNPSLTKIYIGAGITPGGNWSKDAKAQWVNKKAAIVAVQPAVDAGIGAVNIPDANFKAALIAAGVDKNKDGKIQTDEAEAVTDLDVSDKSITSMEGIGAFKNLTNLDCSKNKLNKLDISKNTALTFLTCGSDELTALDISNNVNLRYLFIYYNNLASIDLSKNTELVKLSCAGNQFTSLDVAHNTKLKDLRCNSNQLSSINTSALTELETLKCDRNQIVELDLSSNEKLSDLACGQNQLKVLDISKNAALTSVSCARSPSLTKIYIAPGATPNTDWEKDAEAEWTKK